MNKKEAKKPPVSFPIKTPGQTKVWRVIESVKKGSQEAPIKITIQEIPEDRYEDILEHMCTYFIADEPICKCISKFSHFNYRFLLNFWRLSSKPSLISLNCDNYYENYCVDMFGTCWYALIRVNTVTDAFSCNDTIYAIRQKQTASFECFHSVTCFPDVKDWLIKRNNYSEWFIVHKTMKHLYSKLRKSLVN